MNKKLCLRVTYIGIAFLLLRLLVLLLLIPPPPAKAVQSFVQSKSCNTASGTSLACQFTTQNNTSGNQIVACAGIWSSGGSTVVINSITSSLGNTYSQKNHTVAGASNLYCWVALSIAGGGKDNVTVGASAGGSIFLALGEYSGANTYDTTAGNAVGTTNVSTGNFTTAFPKEILVMASWDQSQNGDTWVVTGGTPSSGWTKREDSSISNGEQGALFDNFQTATGTFNPNVSISPHNSNGLHAIVVTISDGVSSIKGNAPYVF